MAGTQVGEVFVKARPDTKTFPSELRAQLRKMNVDFKVDVSLNTARAVADFRALKSRIESDELEVQVNLTSNGFNVGKQFSSVKRATDQVVSDLDQAKAAFEKTTAALEKAQKAEIDSIVRLRVEQLELLRLRLAGLATASRTARAEARIAKFRDDVAKATRNLAKAEDDNYRAMWRFFTLAGRSESIWSRLGSGISAFFEPLTDIGKRLFSFGSALSSIGGPIIQAVLGVAQFALVLGGLGAILTLVTTAIGVMIGAVGALVGGLASLAALGGGAFAAIALGMEGITEAAKVLEPQIKSLKSSLSKTFKDGLTPVFERLRSLFPSIETGLNKIAGRFVTFADGMSQFFTSIRGAAMLEQIFRNIDAALVPILASVSGLVTELTKVAATKGIMDAWASTISGVVDGISSFISRAHEMGLIESSLTGLDQILRGLLSFFEQVIIAGMEFLTTAAPGIRNFFESWGSLLDRINWAAIGTAISDLFDRAGKAMERIPQDTLDKIVDGIIALSQEVAKFVENGGLEAVADLLYLALVAMTGFTAGLRILAPIIDFVKNLIDGIVRTIEGMKLAFENAGKTLKAIGQIMIGDWAGALDTIKEITGTKMDETAGAMKGKTKDAADSVTRDITSMRDQLGLLWYTLPGPVRDAFTEMENTARSGVKRTADETAKLPNAAKDGLGDVGGILRGSGKSLIQGFINGINTMLGPVKAAARAIVSAARNFFPFSPAKEGPFSGKGYTLYSGRALAEDWARGIEDKAPLAVRAVEGMMRAANGSANAEWNGQIQSDGFGITGSVFQGVMAAFNGSRLQVDGNGMAKLVNKTNSNNARR